MDVGSGLFVGDGVGFWNRNGSRLGVEVGMDISVCVSVCEYDRTIPNSASGQL